MTGMHEAEVVITHAVGLHARPSVALTKLARSLGAPVEIAATREGPWISAASIVKVMALKVPQGATLYLRGEGDGTAEAIAALVGLVERDFDLDRAGGDGGGD